MPGKLIKDVTASALQVIATQVLGLAVFLLTSAYLSKNNYGELNWSVAIFTFSYSFLSLRLEQVVVRKSAIESNSSKILSLYMLHVLLTGVGFYALLLVLKLVFPHFFTLHHLLLVVGISQLLTFIASPFKQIANGKERFDYLSVMSSTSNLVRVTLLAIAALWFQLTIEWVLITFIISSFIELVVSFLLVTKRMGIPLSHRPGFAAYAFLLKESLPQIGSALLMAGIMRMDWILLGIFCTSVVTAEYSFAYRLYELSPFPLLIIAPVVLTRFARFFADQQGNSINAIKKELSLLIRVEMIAATLISLVLNIIWTPVIDFLTVNKYGAVNQYTFLLLSCCLPFQFISNIIWSAHFAQNHLRTILRVTAITFCVVLTGDLLFIPLYGSTGAAAVFLAAVITEYIAYMKSSEIAKIQEAWQSLITCILLAAASGFAAVYFFENTVVQLVTAVSAFFLLLLATRQLRLDDIVFVNQLIRRKK